MMTDRTGPRRWKTWLLTVCTIYPVLVVLVPTVGALLPRWPMPARLAVVVPVAVASLVWAITPLALLRVGGWLRR